MWSPATLRRRIVGGGPSRSGRHRVADAEYRRTSPPVKALEVFVQRKRNRQAALRLMRNLLREQGFCPHFAVTDRLGSYRSALRKLRLDRLHETGCRRNNRAEVLHQPIRKRESDSDWASDPQAPFGAFSPFTTSSTISLTSSDNSFHAEFCASSDPMLFANVES